MSEPYGHPLPKAPIAPCRLGFERARPRTIGLAPYPLSKTADRRAGFLKAQKTRDFCLPAQLDPEDLAGDGIGSLRHDAAANQRLGPAQIGLVGTAWARGDDDGSVPVELGKSHARIAQPAQRVEGNEATGVPADDDVPQLSRGFRSGQAEGLCLLRAIANDEPIAVNADCRAGAAHHHHAVLKGGVISYRRECARLTKGAK